MLVACVTAAAPTDWPSADLQPPAPTDNPQSPIKIELGRRLFYDKALSWTRTMSCASCHEQARGFAVNDKTKAGVLGDLGERNAQSLANVGWFSSYMWAAPFADTLEHQALVPIQGFVPVEMGFAGKSDQELAARIAGERCYPALFAAAFPERAGKIDIDTITMALASFQRSLVSLDSPYDRHRRGERNAISSAAKRGEALFAQKQCSACHAGPHFTDAAMPGVKRDQPFHALAPPRAGDPPKRDTGLGAITHKPEDAGRFRTPGLRNVALSAPYMHNGEVATLGDAIRHHYAAADWQTDVRLKQTVSDAEVADLIAFLETLSDQRFLTNPAHGAPKAGCPN